MNERLDSDGTDRQPPTPAYDPESETYYANHRPDDETPLSTTVLCSVLALDDRQLTELEPLASVIDVDALDALFEVSEGTSTRTEVRFRYHGYDVRVTGDGLIAITPPDENRPRASRVDTGSSGTPATRRS